MAKKFSFVNIIFFVVFGVLTGVLWAYLCPIPLIPGAVHFRTFAFIIPVIGYLFGPVSGFFAGLAGIVLLSRANSAQSTVGKGLEFDVITCVVLGGVSVYGGVGSMSGVIAGVLIIGSLTNGMILMDVSEYTQMVVKGLVLAVAVGIDCMSKKRRKR